MTKKGKKLEGEEEWGGRRAIRELERFPVVERALPLERMSPPAGRK